MSEPQNEATHMDESGGADFDFDAMADEILGYEPEEATQDNDEATEELEGEDPHTDEDADELMKQRKKLQKKMKKMRMSLRTLPKKNLH